MKSSINSKSAKDRILVVEDDRSIREGLVMNLEHHGYEVLSASNGDVGMQMAFDERPDLIVLDIMMAGWSGLDILEELRKRGENVSVLILSAKNSTSDKVAGLNIGADDYMTKPFDLPELIARIKVMLRRQHESSKENHILTVGDITIDGAARIVKVSGKKIDLAVKEFDVLSLLAKSAGKVFTRESILEKVWGWDYEGTERTVDNFVASLRKKLKKGRNKTRYIKTVPTVGYKLDIS